MLPQRPCQGKFMHRCVRDAGETPGAASQAAVVLAFSIYSDKTLKGLVLSQLRACTRARVAHSLWAAMIGPCTASNRGPCLSAWRTSTWGVQTSTCSRKLGASTLQRVVLVRAVAAAERTWRLTPRAFAWRCVKQTFAHGTATISRTLAFTCS